MEKNSIIYAKVCGLEKTLFRDFLDEDRKEFVLSWDFKGLSNPDIYFTEEEAISLARSYQTSSHINKLQIIQPLPNGQWYVLDYSDNEIKYNLHEAPTG